MKNAMAEEETNIEVIGGIDRARARLNSNKKILFDVFLKVIQDLDMHKLLSEDDTEFLEVFKAFVDEEAFVVDGVDWGAEIYERYVALLAKAS